MPTLTATGSTWRTSSQRAARRWRVATKPDPRVMLAEDIAGFTHDPLHYALYAFPWGEPGTLAKANGPREWQREALIQIGEHLSNPLTRHQPCRLGRASGHGIGKSALVSMVTKWGLDTCDDTRIVLTANTETQILNKTWPEVTKWNNLAITRDWFRPTATALISTQAGHDKSWRADAVTWSENNTEAFAGLHNMGKRIILIFDEASGISDKVWEVAQGALTDEDTEILWLAFGNPTKNTGRFREAFGKHRHLWKTKQIDSRTVEGTNKVYLNELVATYGENSDIVKVRVRGMFPSASSMQFIGTDLAQEARTRAVPPGLPSDPIIFGVDCARFGDDSSVLAIRKGRDARSIPWKRWHHMDSMTVAGDIALEAERWKPDAIFVDVGNIGGAVVDRLRQLLKGKIPVFEVNFGGPGRSVEWENGVHVKTANKRSEMAVSVRAWLKRGGVIPDEQEIEDDLTGPEYSYSDGETSILLEKKAHMKARGLPSPDNLDALGCTFAEPVAPRVPASRDPASYVDTHNHYDRFSELH
ncbi:terminase [Sphingomonas sp. DG1-23]|uniref:terminase n=1 Tax=Sphingomonas sp. DG1-23 TaxID=3068316 RepID=UPI00273D7800|nr:terminase [Sphingomonas sp. DG1-23]MDP5279919.1 terminase [Sphingomonas sp. DG1-23]